MSKSQTSRVYYGDGDITVIYNDTKYGRFLYRFLYDNNQNDWDCFVYRMDAHDYCYYINEREDFSRKS